MKLANVFFELDAETQARIIKEWEWLTRCHMPATASRFAGLVDRISGDRDKRLAKCEAEYEAYKAALKRQQGEQLDIFGVAV